MDINEWKCRKIAGHWNVLGTGTLKKIDICFEMTDVGETILQWCQGTVIELVKDKETLKYMDLKIRWNEDEQETLLQQSKG